MSWLSGYLGKQPDGADGANSRPRRNLPVINYVEDSIEEEDLETGLNFDSPLTSPRRPHQSPSVSPRALLQPDPPTTEDVLEVVITKLTDLPEGEDEVVEESGVVFGLPQTADCQIPPVIMVNYDQQNEDDDANAISNARDVRLPFNKNDVKLWFSLIESKMQFAGLKKQWSKRQILIQLIPPEFHSDFKHYLIQQETDAGDTAYFDLKNAIIKQLGPKKADGYDRAVSRVMTGTPSQLGRLIINDICPATRPLVGCHCADTVLGIWRRSLPSAVKSAIADMDFTATTYTAIFDRADNVWSSNASPSVSAVSVQPGAYQVASIGVASASVQQPLDETLPGISYPVPEVAAMSRGRGGRGRGSRGRGGRGGRGGGAQATQPQAGQAGPRHRGTKHPDLPAGEWKGCQMHHRWGRGAFFCSEPATCPWKNIYTQKPAK